MTYQEHISSTSSGAALLESMDIINSQILLKSKIVNPSRFASLTGLRYASCSVFNDIANCAPNELTVELDFDPVLYGITCEMLVRNDYETERYFYHPDHLGSSSFITDANGEGYQHLQYLPYGETSVSQKLSSWSTPYQFSAKEKDEETGFSYFGARYYNSDISVWLSVDPMSDERSWLSPYNYCQWSSVNRTDEVGLLDDHWLINIETGEKTYVSNEGGDLWQHVTWVRPHEDGGLIYCGRDVVEGENLFSGPVRGGWEISNKNLWAGLNEGYNRNSLDYGTGGLYEYSGYDLRKRYDILSNPDLSDYASTILSWESQGLAQPIHSLEFWRQIRYRGGSTDGATGAFVLGYYQMILSLTDAPLKQQSRIQPSRIGQKPLILTPNPNVSSSSVKPSSPWNLFLHLNKGKYSGSDWIKKASDDYYIWKYNNGF